MNLYKVAALAGVVVLGLSGITTRGAAPLAATAFAYDANAPLNVRIVSEHREGTLLLRDITFPSPQGGIIQAQLVLPPNARGTRGAVLFVHWLSEDETSNLTEFHSDAVAVARRGSVAMLIDAMWAKPHWFFQGRSTEQDFANSIHQVVDLCRSLDVLLAQPKIDPARLAFVGHDFGAMYGAVLSGVDPRVRWYVLMAGNPTFSEWYTFFPDRGQPKDKAAYIAQMAPLDPPLYLSRSHAAGFLFQFAKRDYFIPVDHAEAFAAAANAPKTVVFYDGDHSLTVSKSFSDRAAWLEAHLSLVGFDKHD